MRQTAGGRPKGETSRPCTRGSGTGRQAAPAAMKLSSGNPSMLGFPLFSGDGNALQGPKASHREGLYPRKSHSRFPPEQPGFRMGPTCRNQRLSKPFRLTPRRADHTVALKKQGRGLHFREIFHNIVTVLFNNGAGQAYSGLRESLRPSPPLTGEGFCVFTTRNIHDGRRLNGGAVQSSELFNPPP